MKQFSTAVILLASASASAQPTFQWAETITNVATPGSYAGVRDAVVAPDGSVYVSGRTSGPRVIVADNIVEGSTYVAHYDTSGNCLWVKSPGGGEVALDANGDLYVSDSFTGTMQFGPSSLTATGKDAYVAKYSATGQKLWARKMGGALDDGAYCTAVDGLGRVHVGGYFRGAATFGATTLTATHDTTGFHATLDANGNFQWAVLAGGFESWDPNFFMNNQMDCDAVGNTFMAGQFNGTATFGGTSITTTDGDRAYLARYDASGNCTWVIATGAEYGNEIAYVRCTPSGNIYLYGNFRGISATFGGTVITNYAQSWTDNYLALFDANGIAQWAEPIASNYINDWVEGLDVDDAGHAWITGQAPSGPAPIGPFTVDAGQYLAEFDETGAALMAQNFIDASYVRHAMGANDDHFILGHYFGSVEFDLGSGSNLNAALDVAEEGYLARYHDDLSFDWMRRLGLHGAAYDGATSVAADAAGNVYTTGLFYTTAIICDDTLRAPLAATHLYLNKRDANGDCLWTVQIPCSEPTGINQSNVSASIALDPNGDLYFTGRFFGTIDFGVAQLVSAGRQDIFVAKYDANGNCLWAIREGGSDEDEGAALEIDPSGNVLLTGLFKGSVNIAGTALNSASSYADGFLAKYDTNGNGIWAKSFGGALWDTGNGLAVDGAGNTYITGRYTGSATFDALTVNGTGDADLFLAKYAPNGDLLWLVGSTEIGWKQTSDVLVGASGQIYLTGSYYGNLSICTNTLTGDPTNFHAFLSCFDSEGNLLWQKDFPSVDSRGYALAARPAGDIVLSGSFSGSMQVGALGTNGNGLQDPFVAAFNSAGEELWAQAMSGNDFWDIASAADVYADEQTVYAIGSFGRFQFSAFDQTGGSMAFLPGVPGSNGFAPNALDSYIVKYGSAEQISPPYNPLGCDGTVQVDEIASTDDLLIAPNPVDRFFAISGDAIMPDALITVHDVNGREVPVVFTRSSDRITVDAAHLDAGIYSVTIRSAIGQATTRFIKN